MAEIITAALTGCVTLIGVLLSNRAAQAVTEEKIRGMERRVEKLEHGCGPEHRPLS